METQLEMTSKWEESFNGVCTVPLSHLDGMSKISDYCYFEPNNIKLADGRSSTFQKSILTFFAQRHESTFNVKQRLSRAPCWEAGYSANAAVISIRSLRSQTMCARLDENKSNASLIWQINLESRRSVIWFINSRLLSFDVGGGEGDSLSERAHICSWHFWRRAAVCLASAVSVLSD